MYPILIAGAGNIGKLIACLLAESGSYKVYLSDINLSHLPKNALGTQKSNIEFIEFDATDKAMFGQIVGKTQIKAVVCALPYFCNVAVAESAREHHLHYFDLTEDTYASEKVSELAANADAAFVPQCGLAPGFVSIVANEYMHRFDKIQDVLMRVGALPQHANNQLKYSLTWSTEGVINEYGNPCYALVGGETVPLQPLEGLEQVEIDGMVYEAFNTSGGLGTLVFSFKHKVDTMNYKTLRYPGHCHQMKFLMNDLKLNEDRSTLQNILENALGKTKQDVVIIYVAVKGIQNEELMEETFVKKIYPQKIAGKMWSAIQVTTASSLCAVVDKITQESPKGLVLQESIPLAAITDNRFGQCYR
ncbi:MAG TPA: saccharopine dehydrogenase C-terminal domain-containing protein [Gammaproteobacteria bacterium]|nr:saccharopine dehydrogenase C-terminal domain-containing protein [Gammaproteobacteria bacterium]